MTEVWAALLVGFATLIGAWGSLLLKLGSGAFSLNPLILIKNYKIIFGLALYAFSSIFFIAALRGGELSVLYPITSLTYIWVSLLSVRLLKEKMNKFKWLGILFIIIGILFIGLGG